MTAYQGQLLPATDNNPAERSSSSVYTIRKIFETLVAIDVMGTTCFMNCLGVYNYQILCFGLLFNLKLSIWPFISNFGWVIILCSFCGVFFDGKNHKKLCIWCRFVPL